MAKQISLPEASLILSSHKKRGKTIVLTGGCFDILHIGHIKFLEKAKKKGNVLTILLESDEKVRRLKGKNRPVFSQKERADVLSALKLIDYIILLPLIKTDQEYTNIISKLKPNIIAIAENDPLYLKKKSQAQKVKAKLVIIPFIETYSSSKLAQYLGIE